MMNDRYPIPVGEWIIFSVSTFSLALGPIDLLEWLAMLTRQIVIPNPHTVLHVTTAKFTVFLQVYCVAIQKWRNFINDEFGMRKPWPITPGTPAIFDIRRSSSRNLLKKIRIERNLSLQNLQLCYCIFDCVINHASVDCKSRLLSESN